MHPLRIKNNDGFHFGRFAKAEPPQFFWILSPPPSRPSRQKLMSSAKSAQKLKRRFEKEKTMCEEIRIYVADLAAYNNGKLHGVWINALDELGDIQEQISNMLAKSPEGFAEEYAIHDYEGFDGYGLGEYEGLKTVHELACFIEEHPEIAGELLNQFGGDLEEAKKAAGENYCGCYNSLADYAEEIIGDTSNIPEHLTRYIDYERMGRDMELGGDVYTVEKGYQEVHVFWNN